MSTSNCWYEVWPQYCAGWCLSHTVSPLDISYPLLFLTDWSSERFCVPMTSWALSQGSGSGLPASRASALFTAPRSRGSEKVAD